MKTFINNKNNGFTLIETLVATMVLTIAISALLNLTTSNFYSARYSNNEVIASYLLQEATDYIRNDRDSIAFKEGNWTRFLSKYSACFDTYDSTSGCYLDVADPLFSNPVDCNENSSWGESDCPVLNFDKNASGNSFYTYRDTGVLSNFKRQIVLTMNNLNPDEIDIKVVVEWKNGNLERKRILQTSLLNWQK